MTLQAVPVIDPDTAPYWDATADGQLKLCKCVDTEQWFHPPLEVSPYTGGPVRWDAVSGRGVVFSFIVVRQVLIPGHVPGQVVAVIELDEQPGLRMSGTLVADPDDVAMGMPVIARIAAMGDTGFSAPEFHPL